MPRRQQVTSSGTNTRTTATLDLNPFTTSEFSPGEEPDNLDLLPCATAKVVRERFLAQHGPAADLPRSSATPKEIRKALLAAEMARWECFGPQ